MMESMQGVRERDRGGTGLHLRHHNEMRRGADVKGDLSGPSEARLSSFSHKKLEHESSRFPFH